MIFHDPGTTAEEHKLRIYVSLIPGILLDNVFWSFADTHEQ